MLAAAPVTAAAAAPAGSDTSGAPAVAMFQALPADSGRVEVAASVLPVPGGAYVAGWSISPDGDSDGLLLKVNDTGDVLWRRKLGGAGDDLLFSLAPSFERGQVMAVGMGPGLEMGRSEGWVVVFEDDGTVVLNRRVSGNSVRFISVERDTGGLVIAGQEARGDSTIAIVYRPNANASSLFLDWKTWRGGPVTRGFAAVPAGGRDAVVVGLVSRPGDEGDGFITRLDARGQAAWSKSIDGAGRQLAYHVSRAGTDGSLLVVGYGDTPDAKRGVDGFARLLGPDGTERWTVALGDDAVDRAVHGVTLADGSSVVVGYSRPPGGKDDDPAAWTTVLYGLDAKGARTWTRRIGGPGRESGRWVAAGESLWVVGQEAAPGGGNRIFVARFGEPTKH